MHRNLLRNQFASTLNPDSMFNVPFKHDIQRNPRIQYQEKKEEQSCKMKTQTTSEEKRRFLSLVSKSKKKLKRSKSNKKMFQKKSHSVVLGGAKNSTSHTNKTQNSLQNSHCKSCTNLNHLSVNTSTKVVNNEQIPINNLLSHRTIPMNLITQPHDNNTQLTKIISHKLNLDTVQPHQFFANKFMKNDERKNIFEKNQRKLLRNVSSGSMGRIFFSVGGERKEITPLTQMEALRTEKLLLTPRFEKQEISNQRKRREGAGFIRSASARKSSPCNKNNPITNEDKNIALFSSVQTIQPSILSQPYKKDEEIDKCITKMSMIRKEINELQSMIHERLETSQLRIKPIYNGGLQTSRVKDMNQIRKEQGDKMYINRGNNLDVRRMINNESRTAIIVNDLNELSRSLCKSKQALMESNRIQQRLNISSLQHNNLTQYDAPQKQSPSLQYLPNSNSNIMNLGEICKLIKCSENISQQLLQKQYVGPTPNQTVNSQFKSTKHNQQNFIIAKNHLHQNQIINRIR